MATVVAMSDIPPPPPPPQPGNQPYPSPSTGPAPAPYQMPSYGAPGPGGPGGPTFTPFQQTPAAAGRPKKALWAMILGILGVTLCFWLGIPAIVAIVLGALGLREIKASGGTRPGKGMAIAGVVLGILGVLATAGFVAVVVTEVAGTKSVFDLEVGDCVELPDDGETIVRIEDFACDEPHGAEVISVGDLGSGSDPYPGDDEMAELVAAECIPDFEDYVGIPYADSVYDIFPITPTEDGWEDDQTYVCLAFERGEELTESIEGAER